MELLDSDLSNAWLEAIHNERDPEAQLERIEIVGGGSINDARRVYSSAGIFFAKINDAESFPEMFECEADGLLFLARNSEFDVPTPISTGVTDNTQWILMENIKPSSKKENFWEDFGRDLAEMHRNTQENFGYSRDNYLGSLRQRNNQKSTWAEFFVSERLEPQLKMAKDKGEASDEMVRLFEKLFSRAERYFPVEKPSAIHGDMWTGNFMTDSHGKATIFDPAAYYGHREMDLGMSKLFGGYDQKFYEAYHEAFPLEAGWEERLDIANLYPLLAHLNLFGSSYAFQIMGILRKKV